jgi:hypothetical protein
MREGDHLEEPGAHEWVIIKRIFEKWGGGMHGIYLS